MQTFHFYMKKGLTTEQVWQELEALGIQPLYSEEEEATQVKQIVGTLPQHLQTEKVAIFQKLENVEKVIEGALNSIDWHSQWALHGYDFHDGFVHIPINQEIVKLAPGPGFGDLSHPTTQLMLEMMNQVVKDKIILDIGCGSGILALAALAREAQFAYGIDIDEDAIMHAQENAKINRMEKRVEFCLPSQLEQKMPVELPCSVIAVMNMIQSEQQLAWASLTNLHARIDEIFVSGLLEEEKKTYLQLASARGWQLKELRSKDGWLGLYFLIKRGRT